MCRHGQRECTGDATNNAIQRMAQIGIRLDNCWAIFEAAPRLLCSSGLARAVMLKGACVRRPENSCSTASMKPPSSSRI